MIDALWQIAAGTHGSQRTTILRHGQFRMPCDLNEMLQRQFYFFGTYFVDESILKCWANVARTASVAFDVGANAGIFSLAALAVQPDLTVHAFEPTSEIAARLRKTAILNGLARLHVHEVAVSRKDGHATLRRFRGEAEANEGMNFITTNHEAPGDERVTTVSLDHFCFSRSIDYVDLLKIDIQGHEDSALAGAEHLIKSGRIGTIFTELNWAKQYSKECPASKSIQLLDDSGYEFSTPEQSLHWKRAGDWLRSLDNVVARKKRS